MPVTFYLLAPCFARRRLSLLHYELRTTFDREFRSSWIPRFHLPLSILASLALSSSRRPALPVRPSPFHPRSRSTRHSSFTLINPCDHTYQHSEPPLSLFGPTHVQVSISHLIVTPSRLISSDLVLFPLPYKIPSPRLSRLLFVTLIFLSSLRPSTATKF